MLAKGVLTVNDPYGKYMGMQSDARNFLININIDISFLGPAEHPTAVVLKLTPYPSSEADEERAIKENAELRARDPQNMFLKTEEAIREIYRKRRMTAMYMKADYFKNASPELFATLLSKAVSRLGVDQMKGQYGTYNIYYNNGTGDYCTEEEFYFGTANFAYQKNI